MQILGNLNEVIQLKITFLTKKNGKVFRMKKHGLKWHEKVYCGISVPLEVNSILKPRLNFQKADWSEFSSRVDAAIRFAPIDLNNYERFLGLSKALGKIDPERL